MVFLEFMAFILVVLAVVGVISLISWARTRLDGNRKSALTYSQQLRTVEHGVREIANTSTDPDSRLQASILLDEIAKTYESKELN